MPRGNSAQRGYGHRWRIAREHFLRRHPLCVKCQDCGRVSAATVVDHIEPHKGDQTRFWDSSNWQPLCKRCHDSIKQREESGQVVGCDASGMPLDAAHHWREAGRGGV